MEDPRRLDWPGSFNVRDLGGLPTADGRQTLRGAVVRADSLERLSAAGWEALSAHGVRTVIDLRNDDERGRDGAPRPSSLITLNLELDQITDSDFWAEWEHGPQFATPLYYRAHFERFPERSAAVIAAIARAQPGGVVFHCVRGRDRTGQIAIVLLALAGVTADVITADYLLSHDALSALSAAAGLPDEGLELQAFLAARGTTAAELIAETISALDIEALLRAGGLGEEDLRAVRRRLLGAER
jgi:protein-tyrosine phosphatase